MKFPKKIVFVFLALAIVVQPLTARAKNDDYSWRRQLAAIEVAVDSYRLVLRELENMVAQFHEEAVQAPVGVNDRHLLWKVNMGQSYKGLMGAKSDDLPLLLKMVHQNLLEQVELATEWEDPVEFFAIVEGLVLNFQTIEAQIKLYEKYGQLSSGFHDEFVDEDTALELVEEAVLNVQRDLLAINKAGRELNDGSSEQEANKYQLLVRLNLSLRNLLEAMALAGQAGVDIGFTPQMVTTDYSKKVALFETRLARITKQLKDLKRPLPHYNLDITARCGDDVAAGVEVKLGIGRRLTVEETKEKESWQPQLLIQRRPVLLDGASWHPLSDWQTVERQPFEKSRILTEVLPGGQVYEYLFKIGTLAGVYSSVDQITVACPAGDNIVPSSITAEAAINGTWRDDLTEDRTLRAYRELDVINVSWPLAPIEQLPRREKSLKPNALDHYELMRSISDGDFETVAVLPPGTTYYEDRVSLERLKRTKSVRYQVKVVDRSGREALSPVSAAVNGDWEVWAQVAQAGYFEYTNTELDLAISKAIDLYPEYIVKAAHEWLVGVGKDLYPDALARYWQRAPESLKIKWYGDEQKVRYDGDSLCMFGGPAHYIERDHKRLITEIWLALQPEVVSMEPARWWKSLARSQQEEYLERWWNSLNQEYREFLKMGQNQAVNDEMVPAGRENAPWQGLAIETLSPAVTVSWYDSLDSIEQGFLEYFWREIEREVKVAAVAEWWMDQPEAYRHSVCFPAYNGLSKDERAAYLKSGYEDLSVEVRARFLPYVFFEAASWGEKADVVHHVEDSSRASHRKMMFEYYRPLDVACGFKLDKILIIAVAVLFLAVGGWLLWRKRRINRY